MAVPSADEEWNDTVAWIAHGLIPESADFVSHIVQSTNAIQAHAAVRMPRQSHPAGVSDKAFNASFWHLEYVLAPFTSTSASCCNSST